MIDITPKGARQQCLLLIKHAMPFVVRGVPAADWSLSDEGRLSCAPLAERLVAYDLQALVTSLEPKAVQTGQLVADHLRIPVESAPGLQEQDRRGTKFLSNPAQFDASVAAVFKNPGERVYGNESADEAHLRFAAAVEQAIARHPASNLGIVAHGTVMALYAGRCAGIDARSLWQSLGLPAFIALSIPGMGLLEVVTQIGQVPSTQPSQPGPG